jgi:hypothetical protein
MSVQCSEDGVEGLKAMLVVDERMKATNFLE